MFSPGFKNLQDLVSMCLDTPGLTLILIFVSKNYFDMTESFGSLAPSLNDLLLPSHMIHSSQCCRSKHNKTLRNKMNLKMLGPRIECPMKYPLYVSSFFRFFVVRLSVCSEFFSRTARRNFLIFARS